MKYRWFKLICFAFLASAWTACTKEIEFDGDQSAPLLVVNGLQQVGQPAWLCVEKSVFFLDDQPDRRVKDVRVDLFVNGAFKEHLMVRDSLKMEHYYIWDEDGDEEMERLDYAFNYCVGEYLLCEGDEIRFEVSSSEFETATAVVTMPEAPQVISFDTVRVEPFYEYGQTVHFSLKLKDSLGSDYYNLCPTSGLSGFSSTDPVFTDLMTVDIEDMFSENEYYGYGPYNVFNDRFFDGNEYSLSLEITESGFVFEWPFILEVTRVNADFYQYYKSYQAYESHDTESLVGMFTEPVQVYSNVQNAIGIVGSQSRPVVMTIDLTSNYYN